MVEYGVDVARRREADGRTYWSEYCYHAQMEPMNCVALRFGRRAVGPKSGPGAAIGVAADALSGILKTTRTESRYQQLWERMRVNAIQATILSNITKKPVKLVLTREDDVAAARPRPITHQSSKRYGC